MLTSYSVISAGYGDQIIIIICINYVYYFSQVEYIPFGFFCKCVIMLKELFQERKRKNTCYAVSIDNAKYSNSFEKYI